MQNFHGTYTPKPSLSSHGNHLVILSSQVYRAAAEVTAIELILYKQLTDAAVTINNCNRTQTSFLFTRDIIVFNIRENDKGPIYLATLCHCNAN